MMPILKIYKLILLSLSLSLGLLPNLSVALDSTILKTIGQAQVDRPKTSVTQTYLLEQLQQATQTENAAWVKDLLAKGADPGQSGSKDKHSALTIALSMNQMQVAYSMLPYLRTDSFNTAQRAIFYTARQGDLALLNALLNFTGEAALEPHSPATRCEINEAIHYGHQAIVERLYNFRPECQDQLLFTSIQYGQADIFTWLVKQASAEQKQALTSQNYMQTAIQLGNLQLIQHLEQLGNKHYLPEEAIRAHQLTVLKYYTKTGKLKPNAANYKLVEIAAKENSVEILAYLKSLGINPTQTTLNHEPICTPATLIAAQSGAHKALEWLLAEQVSTVDTCLQNTLLHAATQGYQTAIVEWLLKNKKNLKLDINAANTEGDTALHLAVKQNSLSIVNLLLEQRASRIILNQAGNTPLHELLQASYLSNFHAILASLLASENDQGLNIKNAQGDTPLLIALDQPEASSLELLLKAGAKINLANNASVTALHKLAASGVNIPNLLNRFLEGGIDLNQKDNSGRTPLYAAIESYQTPSAGENQEQANNLLEQLLAHKPLINTADHSGLTPLHLAIKLEKLELAQRLIDLGADIKVSDKQANTPLHYAAQVYNSQNLIKTLHAKGAYLDAINTDGNSAIFFSANTDILQTFKDLGANLNLYNKNNESIITFFTSKEDKNLGLALTEKAKALGVDINNTDSYGQNALHRSIRFNSPDLSLSLIKAKINLNQADFEGNTPLMLAVRTRSLYHLKLLIEHGSQVNLANRFGKTALQQAIELGELELFNLLLAAKATINTKDSDQRSPLITALVNHRTDMAAKLIALGADVNIRSKGEWSALHYAVQLGNADLIKVLLEAGAIHGVKNWGNETPTELALNKPEILAILANYTDQTSYFQTTDKFKNTPLHWAVRAQNLQTIETLLPQADLNAQNIYTETPLNLALRTLPHNPIVATQIIKRLLEAGADAKLIDQYGNSSLHYALQNKASLEIVDALLAKQADLTIKNNYGESLEKYLPLQNLAVLQRLFSLQTAWLNTNSPKDTLWTWVVQHPEREPLTAWLLAQGVKPHPADAYTPSTIALAFQAQAYELIKPLIQAGAKLQTDATDLDLLDYLIKHHNLEASLELLKYPDYKVDFSKANELTETWFNDLTEYHGNESTSLVRELIALGAKPINHDNELMKLALTKDADLLIRLYHQKGFNLTGLMPIAAKYTAWRSLDYLYSSQVSLDEKDEFNQTALQIAISDRAMELIRWLVTHGAKTKHSLLTPPTYSLTTGVDVFYPFEDDIAELKFLKELKTLIPELKPSAHFIKHLLDLNNYQALLAVFDTWPNTLAIIQAQEAATATENTEEESTETTNTSTFKHRNFIETLIEHYKADPLQGGLAVLKRFVVAGESVDFLQADLEGFYLRAHIIEPELFKLIYELGNYQSRTTDAQNSILSEVLSSEHPQALDLFQFLLAQNKAAISSAILDSLVGGTSEELRNTQLNLIYTNLIKRLYPNPSARKLNESHLLRMLQLTEFCTQHLDIVSQQIAHTEFTEFFLKEQDAESYRYLPCLKQPEVLKALVKEPRFQAAKFTPLGFLAFAQNADNLEQLKVGTTHLLALGADLNTHSEGATVATLWLNKGLAALNDSQSSLTPALILEGFSYLQQQGFNFTQTANLSHALVSASLNAEQLPASLVLLEGILSLEPELARLPNPKGQQTLHLIAANTGLGFAWQRRLMQVVLKEHPSLNELDQLGNTPLLTALSAGNLALADWLVEQGAEIKHHNQAGETALHFAFSQLTALGKQDLGELDHLPQLIERLLKKGAEVSRYDTDGNTPLHRVAMQACRPTTPKLCQFQVRFAKALLAAKAEADLSNLDGDTPLLLTAYSGNTELAKLFLEQGAQINHTDNLGNQALNLALDQAYYALADELVAHGADIQQTHWRGLSPVQRVQHLQEWGLASVIHQYHPQITWGKPWEAAQETPSYFYELLADQRLIAVNASRPTAAALQIYNHPETNSTLLHLAAQANASEFMDKLLKQQHPVDILNNQGETPLHWAVRAQANQAVTRLLVAGANPQLTNDQHQDALMLAVISNHPSTLQTLIADTQQAGITLDFNQQDNQGNSLLHHALDNDNLQLLEILLKAGVNPELADQQQRTALLYAVEQAQLASVKMLVEHQASLHAVDEKQRTPLLYTIWYYVNHSDDQFKQDLPERLALIDYLLAQGADLQAVEENGNTALHLGMPIYELGQHLLAKGADIHQLNQENETALFQVIAAHYPEQQITAYLQTLLDKGLDINARNKYGETLLSKAVRHDKLQVMTYLLEHGADPTVVKEANPEQAGFTLPMYIVNRNSSRIEEKIKLLSLLKAQGADLNALNLRGENLLFVAVQSSIDNYELVNWLLDQGVSAKVLNRQEQSLLHLIISTQLRFLGKPAEQIEARQRLLARLIQQGLNVNARDMNGRSALHYALQNEDLAWVEPLLVAGINPNLQSNREESALYLALQRFMRLRQQDLSLIKTLLAYQADPNQRDSLGETCLFLAYRSKHQALIQVLLEHGANPNLRSYYGKRADQE